MSIFMNRLKHFVSKKLDFFDIILGWKTKTIKTRILIENT